MELSRSRERFEGIEEAVSQPVPNPHPVVSPFPRYSGEVKLLRCSCQVLVRLIVFERAQFDGPVAAVIVRIDNVVVFRLQ